MDVAKRARDLVRMVCSRQMEQQKRWRATGDKAGAAEGSEVLRRTRAISASASPSRCSTRLSSRPRLQRRETRHAETMPGHTHPRSGRGARRQPPTALQEQRHRQGAGPRQRREREPLALARA